MPHDRPSDLAEISAKQKNLYFTQKFQWRTRDVALYFSGRETGTEPFQFHYYTDQIDSEKILLT